MYYILYRYCLWLLNADRITLQIWTPQNGSNLPVSSPTHSIKTSLEDLLTNEQVFVYIYGGAMVTGGNSNAQWQGHNFARKDVIYVNVNYRESIYASPNAPELDGQSQNFGILDIEMALQWVYDNIRGMSSAFLSPDHAVTFLPSQDLVVIRPALFWVVTPPAVFM